MDIKLWALEVFSPLFMIDKLIGYIHGNFWKGSSHPKHPPLMTLRKSLAIGIMKCSNFIRTKLIP